MTPARRGKHYSFIQHLAWSLWLNHDDRLRFVNTFTANYDASGSEGDADGVLVVAGLIANEYKWKRFEVEWQSVLDKFKAPYFHRKELGDRRFGEGVYAAWSDDKVIDFLRSLMKVLRRQTHKMFCCGMLLKDYGEINAVYRLREGMGSPYYLTAGYCYDLVNAWGKKNYPDDKSVHIFEAGDVGQRDFLRLSKRLGHRIITHPKIDKDTGEWFIPFQGCDLVAGAYRYAAIHKDVVTSWDDYGEVFNELKDKMPQRAVIYQKPSLLGLCRSNPDKCRRRQ